MSPDLRQQNTSQPEIKKTAKKTDKTFSCLRFNMFKTAYVLIRFEKDLTVST